MKELTMPVEDKIRLVCSTFKDLNELEGKVTRIIENSGLGVDEAMSLFQDTLLAQSVKDMSMIHTDDLDYILKTRAAKEVINKFSVNTVVIDKALATRDNSKVVGRLSKYALDALTESQPEGDPRAGLLLLPLLRGEASRPLKEVIKKELSDKCIHIWNILTAGCFGIGITQEDLDKTFVKQTV